MPKKFRWNHLVRFILQMICFFLLPGLFASAFYGLGVVIQGLVNGTLTQVWIYLFPSLFLIAASTLIGRYFCGYMCAFGTLQDGMSFLGQNLFKLKTRIPEKLDAVLKYLKYVVLLALFISFFWTANLLNTYSPWSAFASIFTLTPDFQAAFTTLLPGTLILGALLLLALFFERFFCRYLCPLGAIFSIVSRLRFGKITKERSGCGTCHICTNSCPMGIPLYRYDKVTSGECINCFNCVSSCPRHNPAYSFFSKKAKIWAASIITVSLIGLYYVGNLGINQLYADNGTSLGQTAYYYADGTYSGSGSGYHGTITLSVVISNGKITSITTVSEADNSQYDYAFSTLVPEIISTQSTNVATVSGCTYSSNGIKEAVANALEKAKVITSSTSSSLTSSVTSSSSSSTTSSSSSSSSSVLSYGKYADGTYSGTGYGHRGTTVVQVTISGGLITNITKVSTGDDSKYFNKAWSTIVSRIISAQDADVQTVSGATDSSNGIIEAVSNALESALA